MFNLIVHYFYKKEKMITKQLFDFLSALKENNTREWFHANKKEYESARKQADALITNIIPEIVKLDPAVGSPVLKECGFRINRDIRFANDKSPYKTNMGYFIAKGGRKSIFPGYYLHFEPGSCMIAGGVYMPQPDVLKKIRSEVYFNATEFNKILNEPAFKKNFGELDDFDKLKKAPAGFPPDFEYVDLLKYRSYTVVHSVTDETVMDGNFSQYALEIFKTMLPLHQFLVKAINN